MRAESQPFSVERGLNSEQNAEAIALIGWCWGAPPTVRAVIGKWVWVDMRDRTVKRIKK